MKKLAKAVPWYARNVKRASAGELTPWFHFRIKPFHVGVYEIKYNLFEREYCDGYAYWNGKQWANGCSSLDGAYKNRLWTDGAIQSKHWRGLSKKP